MSLLPAPRGNEPPHICRICEYGCGCHLDGPGCEHYGCWGRWPSRSCPGVAAEETRYEARLAEKRAAEARRLNDYARTVAHLRVLGILTP